MRFQTLAQKKIMFKSLANEIFPVEQLIFSILLRELPVYGNIRQRKIVYWLSQAGVSLIFCFPTVSTVTKHTV
jgi:hypothetical protein